MNLESEQESELSDPAADSEGFSEEDLRAKFAEDDAELRNRRAHEQVNSWLQNTQVKI